MRRLQRNRAPSTQFAVGGIDEAGRGPLAGPVTAAAVVLRPGYRNARIKDSKQLSEDEREALYLEILQNAVAASAVSVGPRRIELWNIREATRAAMLAAARRVEKQLRAEFPEVRMYFLVDGNMRLATELPHEPIIKGDDKILSISAASILAKVTRDRIMRNLDRRLPQYGFASHKGYATSEHLEKIVQFGPSVVHRRTFAGVREHLPAGRRGVTQVFVQEELLLSNDRRTW